MASADYRVLTPERVNLEYGIAGIGSRAAAALVDTGIQLAALIVLVVGLTAGFAVLERFSGVSGGFVGLALFTLAVFAVANGYYILFEILWNGQTPGK